MKKILFILPVLFSVSYAQTKKPAAKPTVKKAPVKVAMSETDSLSYAMGVQTAQYYKMQGAEHINTAMVKKAYDDVYNNKTLLIPTQQCDMTIQQKLQQFMTKKNSVEKEKGAKFLEENKKKPGVITLPDGMQYEIITKGTGALPTAADTGISNGSFLLYELSNSVPFSKVPI